MPQQSDSRTRTEDLNRRIFATGLFLLVTLGSAVLTDAQERADRPLMTQKRAWEWTIEERLAVRLDPAKIAERQNAGQTGHRTARAQSTSDRHETPQNHTIEGSRNPELLLSHELFQSVLMGIVPDEERRTRKRESLRAGIVAAGFDEDHFWTQLSAASEYVENHASVAPRTAASQSDGARFPLCRAAFTALNNARQMFGPDRFDRFLYEFVAPHTWVASSTNATDPAAELRHTAGGCQ